MQYHRGRVSSRQSKSTPRIKDVPCANCSLGETWTQRNNGVFIGIVGDRKLYVLLLQVWNRKSCQRGHGRCQFAWSRNVLTPRQDQTARIFALGHQGQNTASESIPIQNVNIDKPEALWFSKASTEFTGTAATDTMLS
ncbi:Hypothetical predicted protein [Paramuricea clavata]|uniref:Uncharacterized protein n=1 Tax=Paramuricea clavata TaxID=317549 RepID=A0A6S7GZ94_PARCT|nr:Hypothetical predicted protein [Paramuricea clavata]